MALLFGSKLALQGSWDRRVLPQGRLGISLVPQERYYAFGNGYKRATRKFLDDLENHIEPGMTVLDIGTGVGVLAIAAVKLGAGHVIALEPGDAGHIYAPQNFRINRVEDKVSLMKGWYPEVFLPRADLVLANLDVIETLEYMMLDHIGPKMIVMPSLEDMLRFDANANHHKWFKTKTIPDGVEYNYIVLEETEARI